ncbi:YqaJ viral recombinase family protein [Bosea sp. F3-2]|uniref:YqaJ viral recombinase family protein n=1 Tax=Bosea sp. F3-2 TaxID=2599640 RepID=UPI0020BF93DF|nr:YqaJ viral recombinase family protein [Bosea sp. F3-2]
MTMLEIVNCIQGSPEWAQARLGIPTASEFASILTKGRGGAESRTRQSYLYKLAGERLTGEVMACFSSPHLERGRLMEEEARSAYSFVTGLDCESLGFLRRGQAGASPDALIGEDGLLEIKTKLPHLLIEALLKG